MPVVIARRKEQGQQLKQIEVTPEVGADRKLDFVHGFPFLVLVSFVLFVRGMFISDQR